MDDRDAGREIEALRQTLRRLRGDGGCPWDRQQTLDDIISYLIDESYELLHAERSRDGGALAEEFGDVIFLVVFIHELILERMDLPLSNAVRDAHRKIVSRHPHVFGSTAAADTSESVSEWERIKKAEKRAVDGASVLSGIPSGLPPLRHAYRIQKKAAGAGFDWPDHKGVLDKLKEEISELEAALESGERERIKDEIGDLFFTLVNLARRLHIDSESAIETSSSKFIRRFEKMQERAKAEGTALGSMNLDELERLWQESKKFS